MVSTHGTSLPTFIYWSVAIGRLEEGPASEKGKNRT